MPPNSDILRQALDDFCVTLRDFPSQLSREVTNELLYALTHLVIGYRWQDTDGTARRKECERALGHIRRAHLDYLKILLLEKHRGLVSVQATQASAECEVFQKALVGARLKELNSVGTDHTTTNAAFRALLHPYHAPFMQGLKPNLADADAVQAAFPHNTHVLLPEERRLLWEWLQLEVMFVALSGQRDYAIIFNMIEAYLCRADFLGALQHGVTILKSLIVLFVRRIDSTGHYRTQLAALPDWHTTTVPAVRILQQNRYNTDAARSISDTIDAPFALACEFLGSTPTPLVRT